MRLRFCVPLLVLFPIAGAAQNGGTVSAYGTVALSDYGYAFNGEDLDFHDHVAVGGGAFYNFPVASRATFGVDARGSYAPGDTGGAKGFVSGRVGFVPQRHPLRPYFQVGVGEIHARVPRPSYTVGRSR